MNNPGKGAQRRAGWHKSCSRLVSEDLVEPGSCLALGPGAMAAVLEQDKDELTDGGGKGLPDALGWVRVVVAVNRHHRTPDAPGRLNKPAGASQLPRFAPYAFVDIVPALDDLIFPGKRIKMSKTIYSK